MPIRINLLAEAQAAEDMRRRDPVKRAAWGAAAVVIGVLAWSGSNQLKVMKASTALDNENGKWSAIEKKYQVVVDNAKSVEQIQHKLGALTKLSANRFFWGTALNALQQSVVDQVVVTRIKTEQLYNTVEPPPPKNGVPAGKPVAIESLKITIDARDYSPAERNFNKFKASIAANPFFQQHLQRSDAIRLLPVSAVSTEPSDPTRSFVSFALEIQFPEARRDE